MVNKFKYIQNLFLRNKLLFGVFFVAFFLRFYGINYGLPLTFNMDENSFVGSVTGLRFSLNPNRFDWPHTHMYLSFFSFMLFYYFRVLIQLLNLRPILEGVFPLFWTDPAIFYLIARILNVFMGALTVFPLYFATKMLFKNSRAGILTSFIFAILPFAVFDAHLATLDTPMTLWVCFFLYYSFRLIDNPDKRNFLFSGIFMGLAFGTKYNAVFYYIVFIISILYSTHSRKNLKDKFKTLFSAKYLKNYITHILGFFTVYLVTNPTIITNFKMFWSYEYGRGFLFQFKNVSSLAPREYQDAFVDIFVSQLPNDLGIFLYVFIIFGSILYLFFNYRNKISNLSIFFCIFIFLYMCTKSRHPSHYFLFIYPLLSIFTTKLILDLYYLLLIYFKKYAKPFIYIFTFVLLSPSLYSAFFYTYKFGNIDNRLLMNTYIETKLPKGNILYIYGNDLDALKFNGIDEVKMKRFDVSVANFNRLPFYVLIGDRYVTKEELLSGERDTPYIKGNEGRFLRGSELISYFDNLYTWGPKMYLFKTNYVETRR